MPEPITIFRGSIGLNVKIDPTRLHFDPATGMTDIYLRTDTAAERWTLLSGGLPGGGEP